MADLFDFVDDEFSVPEATSFAGAPIVDLTASVVVCYQPDALAKVVALGSQPTCPTNERRQYADALITYNTQYWLGSPARPTYSV